jgi:hypothetical protein
LEFKTWKDFREFQNLVKYERRYIHSKPVVEFLGALEITLPERVRALSKGGILHRSQIGYEEVVVEGEMQLTGFRRERMKPNREFCGDGRANPRGIPYLYLSSDENTSMAELRPQRGQMLSTAQFEVSRNLRIIDCFSVIREIGDIEFLFSPPSSQDEIRNAIWSQINQAFSRPIARGDSIAEYIPTQILVEFFLHHGFDGVCFKSGLGKGLNFVLFDLSAAELINCGVYDVKSVDYEFAECANRYYKRRES